MESATLIGCLIYLVFMDVLFSPVAAQFILTVGQGYRLYIGQNTPKYQDLTVHAFGPPTINKFIYTGQFTHGAATCTANKLKIVAKYLSK